MGKTLKNKLPLGITPRELDLSPAESQERIKRVLEKQKETRKSTKYYISDLKKIYFPQFGPKHYR